MGLERRGFSDEVRKALKQTYRTLFQSSLGLTRALAKAEEDAAESPPEVRHFLSFIRASERGVTV